MEKERKTNADFIKSLIEEGHPLNQMFLVDAIEKQCKQIISHKEDILKQEKKDEEDGRINLISMKSWIGVAEDIDKKLKEFYKQD